MKLVLRMVPHWLICGPMRKSFFEELELSPEGYAVDLEPFMESLSWNDQGLIPVITQQYDSGEVLMMAWMNRESLAMTLKEKRVTYWSRSRQQLWEKGKVSGNTQRLIELRADCDGDTLLCLADQQGPACHTGRANCFYFRFCPEESQVVVSAGIPDPEDGHSQV